ncbi:MAG: hypothetical protein H0W61_11945 [Bacteroidetes bacterium]|nr:hypothetical protein [Bacteroidota bacterium]
MNQFKNTVIEYRHGFFLPKGGLVFGVAAFCIAALLISRLNYLSFISIPVVLIGFVCFATTGLLLNVEERSILQYTKVLGKCTGGKRSFNEFGFVTIIRQQYSVKAVGKPDDEALDKFATYNVLLTSKTFFLKQLVKQCQGYEEALKEAQTVSAALGFELVKYKPVAATRKKKG